MNLQAGDSIPAYVGIQGTKESYPVEINITFVLDQHSFLTCGHCVAETTLSSDTIESYCTSGFLTTNESIERAIVNVSTMKLSKTLFTLPFRLPFSVSELSFEDDVYLIRKKEKIKGFLISDLDSVTINNNTYQVDVEAPITKLSHPYVMILPSFENDDSGDTKKEVYYPSENESKHRQFSNCRIITRLTTPGDSGLPWVQRSKQGNEYVLVGCHIGCTKVYLIRNHQVEFVTFVHYAKIVNEITCPL